MSGLGGWAVVRQRRFLVLLVLGVDVGVVWVERGAGRVQRALPLTFDLFAAPLLQQRQHLPPQLLMLAYRPCVKNLGF